MAETKLTPIEEVVAERRRQVEVEGWTPEHDDEHGDGSMALAAACYAMFASVSDDAREATTLSASLTTIGRDIPGWSAWLEIWPWERRWWKPKDRRHDLIRAAALIVAEIERLDRGALTQPETCHADRDGDCRWTRRPQLLEGEPKLSGRHCPLDTETDDHG